jgi:hypothetical protein
MKKTALIGLTLMICAGLAFGQTDTLKKEKRMKESKENDEIKTIFGPKTIKGGYLAIDAGYTTLSDRYAFGVGLRGGSTVNHWFTMGIGGAAIVNNLEFDNIDYNRTLALEMGYGGIFIEPTILPKLPVHITFPILGGLGWAGYYDKTSYLENDGDNDHNNQSDWNKYDDDVFLFIEPGADLELNMTKHVRLNLGVKYRYLWDLDLVNTPTDQLDGLSGHITLKFGKF